MLGWKHCKRSWPITVQRELTDRKIRGSNLTSASRLLMSRLGQPGSSPALVLPSGGMAGRHRKGVTAEQFLVLYRSLTWLSVIIQLTCVSTSTECAATGRRDIAIYIYIRNTLLIRLLEILRQPTIGFTLDRDISNIILTET
ncbi:hypothetical protein CSKR_100691 [Clonorchis sinensis]|uniref:Uncharacterized protein n=1 Tax=Clonorchis sinensis TaxID=79923 RepID=A0A419PL13_CLOSI|nr:hypothetical protein CSKR_100691 [Clonorchis sinensis]